MSRDLFDSNTYKEYLRSALPTSGSERGQRARLAQYLKCQTAFVSQVLNAEAHFSLEHAISISEFLNHTTEEAHFFMLQVQWARAGSKRLRDYYRNQMDAVLAEREVIRNRLRVKGVLSADHQTIYYSAWYYSAIHVMLSVPQFQSPQKIAAQLNLPLAKVQASLEFLLSAGLASKEGSHYKIGTTRIHLGKESPHIAKHHANWRLRALNSLDTPAKDDVHYSSVISLSESDVRKIRHLLLGCLAEVEPIMIDSKEESVHGLALDFFRVS